MLNLTRKVTATGAATALVASGVALTTLTPRMAYAAECTPTDAVTIFAINDFHGRISKAANLFTPVDAARTALGDDNVALISSGDNIGASTFESMIADDKPTLDILNEIGLDTSTVGNHEFDKGWSDLSGRVVADSAFPYVGANVYVEGTMTVAAPLSEYTIITKGGMDIAVVGAVTADLPALVSPAGIADLEIGDEVEAINRVTDKLLDGDAGNGEADVVLASLHEGAADGSTFDGIDERVAAIFNGHTHGGYVYTTSEGQPVIQAGSYGDALSKVTIGTGCSVSAEVVEIDHDNAPATTPTIEAISAIYEDAKIYADVEGAKVVGETSAAISTPNDGSSGTRDHESPMSNLVAEMFFEVLSDGDPEFIGLQNPGGTRDSFDAGDVTLSEAALTLPFANSLFTTQITGTQFKTVLEQQWQRLADGKVPSRPFLALGMSKNVSYTYDESLAEGDRITSIRIDGAPIDPEKLYTVGSGSFLISGGDNFRELANGVNTTDTGRADLEAWTTWIGEQDVLSPDYTKRGVSVQMPGDPIVVGGDAVEIIVGEPVTDGGVAPQTLDMFLGEGDKVSSALKNTKLTAFLAGVEVGSAEVVDGMSTLELELKTVKGMGRVRAGDYTLTLVAEDSGTRIYLPIEVESNRPAAKVK